MASLDKTLVLIDNQKINFETYDFHYVGYLTDDPEDSYVTGSLIDGIFYGTIETKKDGIFYIEPIEPTKNTSSIIYQQSDVIFDENMILFDEIFNKTNNLFSNLEGKKVFFYYF